MKSLDVISVCNALVDLVYEANDNDLKQHGLAKANMTLIERPTQTALVEGLSGRQKAFELGGSSMNAIRALALLGNRTAFTGMIADDQFGQLIASRLAELGIKGQLHSSQGSEGTGACMVLVTPDGERTMATYLGASRLYNKEHMPIADIRAARIFHFSGYQWDTQNQKDAILYGIKEARKAGTLVSFDIADPFVVSKYKNEFVSLLPEADLVFANQEEARMLFGLSPEATAAKIAASGAVAIVKLGSKGALIQKGEQVVHVQPVATKVVDTTAAGDMFAAGFLHGYARALPLDECGRIAATLASDVISRYGALLSDEVIEKIRRLYH